MKWFLGALVLLVLGALFRLGLLVYAMYALLGVMLVSRFLARRWVESIHVERECDRTEAQIGETVSVTVTARNLGRLAVPWVIIEEVLPREAITAMPPRLRWSGTRLAIQRLPAGGIATLRYEVAGLMRGYYQLGPVLIESGDLFGLHRRFRVASEPHFLLVPPRVIPLESYDLMSPRPVGEVRIVHRFFEDPTRISGVRDYQHGDPLNRIHWRATARTGTLQSKTYEPSIIAGITLVLEFHQHSLEGHGASARTELAAMTTASLAHAVHQMGQPVGLITNGRDAAERIREEGWNREFRARRSAQEGARMHARSDRLRPVIVETRRGPDQLARILETLARLEPTDGLTFPELVHETVHRLPRNTTLVALVHRFTEESAVLLAGFRRRGYAVTVVQIVFDEPATPEWAQGPDWAAWLIAAGVDIRRVTDEASIARLAAEQALL